MFKLIKGFKDYYITDCGIVISSKRKYLTVLSPALNGSGYLMVSLEGKSINLHRLVAQHFLVGYLKGLEVNHIDGNKLNNKSTNLEWVTRSENIKHAFRTNLKCYSRSFNPRSKLTEENINYIRSVYPNKSQALLAKELKVHFTTINAVIKNRNWLDK